MNAQNFPFTFQQNQPINWYIIFAIIIIVAILILILKYFAKEYPKAKDILNKLSGHLKKIAETYISDCSGSKYVGMLAGAAMDIVPDIVQMTL